MEKMIKTMVLITLLFFSATAVMAEMIYLKDGQVLSGKIIAEDTVWITVKTKYQTRRIKRSDIKRIMYGDRKMERIYIQLNNGQMLEGFMVDQDAQKVIFKKTENASEEIVLKKDIRQMSPKPFVPLDMGLMLRAGIYYPFNSGGASLGVAPVILAAAGLNLPVKNMRVLIESGYYSCTSTEHDNFFMMFIPVTAGLVYDFQFGIFHLLPKIGVGTTITYADDGEGVTTTWPLFNFFAGAGARFEIIRHRFYTGFWIEYHLHSDFETVFHGIMLTASISYRF